MRSARRRRRVVPGEPPALRVAVAARTMVSGGREHRWRHPAPGGEESTAARGEDARRLGRGGVRGHPSTDMSSLIASRRTMLVSARSRSMPGARRPPKKGVRTPPRPLDIPARYAPAHCRDFDDRLVEERASAALVFKACQRTSHSSYARWSYPYDGPLMTVGVDFRILAVSARLDEPRHEALPPSAARGRARRRHRERVPDGLAARRRPLRAPTIVIVTHSLEAARSLRPGRVAGQACGQGGRPLGDVSPATSATSTATRATIPRSA